MRIGIDIGGMSIKIGLVNEDYKITSRKVIKTGSSLYTPREIIKNIVEAARGLIEENNAKLGEINSSEDLVNLVEKIYEGKQELLPGVDTNTIDVTDSHYYW